MEYIFLNRMIQIRVNFVGRVLLGARYIIF